MVYALLGSVPPACLLDSALTLTYHEDCFYAWVPLIISGCAVSARLKSVSLSICSLMCKPLLHVRKEGG